MCTSESLSIQQGCDPALTKMHNYTYQGIVFKDTIHEMEGSPGSFWTGRTYFEAFFCSHCLVKRYRRLQGSEAGGILYNATPDPEAG